MTEYSPTFTLPDELLVRYLDEEVTEQERAQIDALEWGSADAVRLWELGEASDRFSALLADLPLPETPALLTRSSRAPHWALKAATVTLLAVAGTAVAMPSTRSAMTRGIDAVSAWFGGVAESPSAQITSRTTITFLVTASDFTVDIEHAQRVGSLSIVRAATSGVVAEVGPAAEFVVFPGRLFVRNSADAEADVTLQVPLSVTTVHVVVAGVETDVELSDEVPSVTIPLRR